MKSTMRALALAAVCGITGILMAQSDADMPRPEDQNQVGTANKQDTTSPTPTVQSPTTQDVSSTTTIQTGTPGTAVPAWQSRFTSLPLHERMVLENLLFHLSDEHDRLVTEALFGIDDRRAAGDRTAMSVPNTYDLLLEGVGSEDRSAFDTMWNAMPFEHQQVVLNLARDAFEGGFVDEPAIDQAYQTNTMGWSSTTVTTDADSGAGSFSQRSGMSIAPATTFVTAMPDIERAVLEANLVQIPRDHHSLIVDMLAAVQNNAKNNTSNIGSSMTWEEARSLMMSNAGNSSGFETMWNGLAWEQQHILVTMVRDAYYGGLGDM